MHLAQRDPGLEAGKQISRTVGFCMISLQRAGVEKLTLAVCLHPELGFAAVLPTAPVALCCVWYPEQLRMQGTPQGGTAGFPQSSVCSQFHWCQRYVTLLHQHRFLPS